MADKIYRVPTIYNEMKKTTAPLTVRVPGSKSITNRSLLLAMLADGESTLRGVLFSDDSRHFLQCVQDLGFETTVDEDSYVVTVRGLGGKIPCSDASLNVGSAGTAARFLTATLGVSEGIFHMDASEQMRKRPMAPLLSSLKELGCEITCEREDGHFPFILTAHGFRQDHISIDIGHSSQFLSALLIASTLSAEDFTIRLKGTHGMAYIEMTRKMMEQFGVRVEHPAADQFRICTGQKYRALDYQIEPDVSAACYFYAMTPLLGIPVCVSDVSTV
jgi:3-phosphoshikimate 1-carboxyvinyltransferase